MTDNLDSAPNSDYVALYSENSLVCLLPRKTYESETEKIKAIVGQEYTVRTLSHDEASRIKEDLMPGKKSLENITKNEFLFLMF